MKKYAWCQLEASDFWGGREMDPKLCKDFLIASVSFYFCEDKYLKQVSSLEFHALLCHGNSF